MVGQIFYVVTLGAFILTLVTLLWQLRTVLHRKREKSVWKRQILYLHICILVNLLLASLCYLYLFFSFFINEDSEHWHRLHVVGMFSSGTIALCGLAMLRLSDRSYVTLKNCLAHGFVPLLIFVLYLLTRSDLLVALNWIYYPLYAIVVVVRHRKNRLRFIQSLEDNYVNLDRRQILYGHRIRLYCLFLFIAWGFYLVMPRITLEYCNVAHGVYFIASIIGWTRLTLGVVKLKDSPLAALANVPSTEELASEQPEPDAVESDMFADSPVMRQLNERLDEVLLRGDLYLDPDLDVQRLAAELCTNRTYLGRVFRLRGTTFSRYINSMRLNYAEKLLRMTSKPVSEIVSACGFSDATFRRAFYDRYHCTPSEYRRSNKK